MSRRKSVSQAYEGVPSIEQLFADGDSRRVCLVGAVILKRAAIAKLVGKETLTDEEFREACERKETHDAVLTEMTAQVKAKGLLGFQQIRDIHLDIITWSTDNHGLTPTFKLRRKNLADRSKQEIEELYATITQA
jgi:long-chain acyl-CoA synthetase